MLSAGALTRPPLLITPLINETCGPASVSLSPAGMASVSPAGIGGRARQRRRHGGRGPVVAPGRDETVCQLLTVIDPQLWHPNHPHLYTLRTLVTDARGPVDDHVQHIGIRHIRFDK